MRRLRLPSRTAAVACALLLAATRASAAPPDLVPPEPASTPSPDDPRPAGAAPRASVELSIDVDRSGNVIVVRVARSAGPDLDAAAIAAVRAITFRPATRDGAPVAARIRYEIVFDARDPPPSEPAPTVPVAPLETAPQTPAPPTSPISTPEPATDEASFGATARTAAPAREVTKHSLDGGEITHLAGTRGDPLLAVELMPGVSRAGSPTNGPPAAPILRGANTFDSQVYVDGAPAPLLYHVGGFTSFLHGRVLERVDLYPSNFSVRYGRKVGGIIEARLRDPRTDRLHGVAEASVLDSSALVETPITSSLSLLAAARRSNVDAFINAFTSSADTGITAAPVYWDYQSVLAWKPNEEDRVRLVAYGSSDHVAIGLKQPDETDPLIRGTFEDRTVFHRVQLGYRHRWRGGSEQSTEITYGWMDARSAFGRVGHESFLTDTVQGRSEWTAVLDPALRLVAGVDALGEHFSGGYEGPPLSSPENAPPQVLSAEPRVAIDAHQWSLKPGAYVEADVRPLPSLLLVPGVRADYSGIIRQGAFDPRFAARLEVTRSTTLKGGVGRYSQPPEEPTAVRPIGNPDLRMTHALHASLGVEQTFAPNVRASLEGFAKWVDGIVTDTPEGRAPYFTNAQDGRIFGAELAIDVKPSDGPVYGFASYTLMRSERRDAGQGYRLFDRDQTHLLSASGVYRLGRGWEAGASLRLTSGAPYTPVTSATYDASADVYRPRLGAPLSARNPAYSRLDLRVQKTWTFTAWSLAMYLDVQNALNAENRDGFDYRYDYRQRQGTRGLPILPILGLRGEL